MIFPLTSKGLPSAGVSPGDAKDALTPWAHPCRGDSGFRSFPAPTCRVYPLSIYGHGKSQFLIGKPSISGPFSMAMLNNQRVYLGLSHTCSAQQLLKLLSYSTYFDKRDFAQLLKSATNCCGLFEGCSTRDETVAGHAHTGTDGLLWVIDGQCL